MSRIYSSLFWVAFQAFCIGTTIGVSIAGKHISAPILVAQFALFAFVVVVNVQGIRGWVNKL